jgi:hypothetical protein
LTTNSGHSQPTRIKFCIKQRNDFRGSEPDADLVSFASRTRGDRQSSSIVDWTKLVLKVAQRLLKTIHRTSMITVVPVYRAP